MSPRLGRLLARTFPRPICSQMLQVYLDQFIEADGHARCFLLLDALEVFTQQSFNSHVASATYSDYKKYCTAKLLGGCNPIGCPWWDIVPDANPSKASGNFMTDDTKILQQVPFGGTVKVDRGFLVNNEAAFEGVILDRPHKRLKKQV